MLIFNNVLVLISYRLLIEQRTDYRESKGAARNSLYTPVTNGFLVFAGASRVHRAVLASITKLPGKVAQRSCIAKLANLA